MGGFEVAEKIDAQEAYLRFPEQRLQSEDGQMCGNIIVDRFGRQHRLDQHPGGQKFEQRCKNFVVGKILIMPQTPGEIFKAREQTMDVLQYILGKLGPTPFSLLGRSAKNLSEKQVISNPLKQVLDTLALGSPSTRKEHSLDLIPETV